MTIPSTPSPKLSKRTLAILLAIVSAPAAHATTAVYSYYRFTPTKIKSGTAMQMSEFRLQLGSTTVSNGATLTASASSNSATASEGYNKLIDNNLTTKWYTSTTSSVTFHLATPSAIDKYSWATANDFDSRDPVSWTLEGSNDNTAWTKLDAIYNYNVPLTRNAYLPDFIVPDALPAQITSFEASSSVVTNGSTVTLIMSTDVPVTSFTLNPGNITIPADSGGLSASYDLNPQAPLTGATIPANADTVYTLTATNSAGTSVAATRGIRSIATSGTANYRYVRFSPTVRNTTTANSVQMTDITFFSAGLPVTAVAATNPGGSNTPTAAEGALKAIDGNSATKWLDMNKGSLIVDFGSPATFDSYQFVTGGDAAERDPIRWTLAGSNDNTTWTRIDDLTTFDVDVPAARTAQTQIFPLPGSDLPPLIASFTGDTAKVAAGDTVNVTWATTDAASVTITGVPGTVAASGSMAITPTTTGTYTLSAISAGGFATTKSLTLAVATGVPALPNYPTFDSENGALSLVGIASILNDHANTPNPSDSKRLRLTPDLTARSGAAWFPRRLSLANGFDTTFTVMLTKAASPVYPAADGFSFAVQNDPLGDGAAGSGETGFANALTIGVDTFFNTGELSNAQLRVSEGTTQLQLVDLSTKAGITVNTASSPVSLTDVAATAMPHTVHAVSTGTVLNVWFDGVQVVTNQTINPAVWTNASGNAYAGFTGRTGGYSVVEDVPSWTLSLGSAPTQAVAITAYSINPTTGQATLTWNSNAGKTYHITTSTDLVTFTQVGANVSSGGTTTSSTFGFTPGTKGFFRVEEQ